MLHFVPSYRAPNEMAYSLFFSHVVSIPTYTCGRAGHPGNLFACECALGSAWVGGSWQKENADQSKAMLDSQNIILLVVAPEWAGARFQWRHALRVILFAVQSKPKQTLDTEWIFSKNGSEILIPAITIVTFVKWREPPLVRPQQSILKLAFPQIAAAAGTQTIGIILQLLVGEASLFSIAIICAC
jgi:hypothetical protein